MVNAAGTAVSIGILCYNQADLIGRVIESALAQTVKVNEIIVVDDGSSDDSRPAVGRYPGVRLVEHEVNRGRAAARSSVLTHATGDIVVYLDGDTLAAPDLVESILCEYVDPTVGAVGGVVEEHNLATVFDHWRSRNGTAQALDSVNRDAPMLFGWGLSCRRVAGLATGGFLPAGEDIDFTLRLRHHGYRLVHTPQARVFHQRSDSFRSLRWMMYRWAFGGYVAIGRNGDRRVWPHLRRMARRVGEQVARDAVANPRLALVTVALVPWEIWGLMDGVRFLRGDGRVKVRVHGL